MQKKLTLASLICLIAVNSPVAAENDSLKDSDNRINYSLGYQIGQDLVRQQIELRQQDVSAGMTDGYNNRRPKVEPQIMRQSLSRLKGDITDDMQQDAMARVETRQKRAAELMQQSTEFLAMKKQEPGVVVLDSGLQYKVIREGHGESPGATDLVTMSYEAHKMDGKRFDSSKRHGDPVQRRASEVIAGVAEALQLMKPGAKWELYIPPQLAYGRRDGPLGNQAVIIKLELIDFESDS